MTSDTGQSTATSPTEAGAPQLRKYLTLPGAVALAITIVVGSGVLVLPGIAYAEAGNAAIWGWLISAILVAPLLVIFGRLGAAHPTAGGVAGFVQAAFGRSSAGGVEMILLGTFSLGIPAIALTGGHYFAALLGLPSASVAPIAAGLLIGAAAVNIAGVRLSSRVQTILAIGLTIGLVAVGLVGLFAPGAEISAPDLNAAALRAGLASVAVLFFAFTGWEILSFTAEEYRNPRRDFPRAVTISFLLVTGVYLLLAFSVQSRLAPTDPRLGDTPIAAVVDSALGGGASRMVAALGVVIITANLVGAVWGASRLVMSSAREGLLPAPLSRINDGGVPHVSIITTVIGFIVVLTASAAGLLSLADLLTVAGGNFFLLYLLSAGAYVKLFPGVRERVFGTVILVALSAVMLTFGWQQLLYAGTLAAIGALLVHRRARRSTPA
jgi:amino acid efflux transporter